MHSLVEDTIDIPSPSTASGQAERVAASSQTLAHAYAQLLTALDLPPRNSLCDTPMRAAKALQELTQGYQQSLAEIVHDALFPIEDIQQLVIVKQIDFCSLCEHHLLPFFGQCHIAYLPDRFVLGLSKVGRIVEMYAQRLQIQEQLTHEIATAIQDVTQAKGVGVVIEAHHLCMMIRGVKKQAAAMRTCTMRGLLHEDVQLRADFLHAIP